MCAEPSLSYYFGCFCKRLPISPSFDNAAYKNTVLQINIIVFQIRLIKGKRNHRLCEEDMKVFLLHAHLPRVLPLIKTQNSARIQSVLSCDFFIDLVPCYVLFLFHVSEFPLP
jgi:hypothetical protein